MPSRKHKVLFFLATLFLCSWHLDAGHNDNTTSRALAVAALVGHGSLEITSQHDLTGDKAVIDGRYYSDKAPLPVFVVAPFWWIGKAIGMVEPGEHGSFNDGLLQLGGFLCGSLPLALIITLLWSQLSAGGARNAAGLALLSFLGSFLFVYCGSFYGHLPGAVLLLLALIAFDRGHLVVSGALSGAAVLCEYPLAVFPLCWAGILAVRSRRQALRFMLGGSPAILILLAHNWLLSGDPFSLGYAHEANYTFMSDGFGFGMPTWEAIAGLSVSPYRGLLFYMPVLIAGAIAWLLTKPWRSDRLLGPVFMPVILCFFLIASYAMWWGGWAYGPRHLTAAAVLLAWRTAPLIAERRWTRNTAVTLATFGFACAFLAKSTLWYSLPTGVHDPLVEEVLIRAAAGEWTHWQWPVQLGLSPEVATLLYLLIFGAALFSLSRMDRSMDPA